MRPRITRTYSESRRAAYPEIGQALDAIAKQLGAMQARGERLEPEAAAWVDRCQEVKRRFPKGEGI